MINRKGITPVMSIVLLVLLMIGLIGGTYVYLQSFMSQSDEASQKMLNEELKASKTILTLSSKWDDVPGDNWFNISVKNTGPDTLASSLIENANAYIDDAPVNIIRVDSGDVAPGKIFYMSVNKNLIDNKGKVLKIVFGNGAVVISTI